MAAGLPPLILLLPFVLVFLSCPFLAKPDLESDKLALLAIRDAVGTSTLHWNASLSPCLWRGIVCESGRGVSAILLSGVGLFGEIPCGPLSNLTALRTLNLGFNTLSGSLPSDLAALVELQNLSLHNNHFSGEIPSSISSMESLVQLNLAGNRLSGGIPSDIRNLWLLRFLHLEENELTGGIPDFNLSFEEFNVSYNRLKGSIPPSLRTMPVEAFLGLDVCRSPLGPCPSDKLAPAPRMLIFLELGKLGGKLSWLAIVGIIIGSVVVFFVLPLLLWFVLLLLACGIPISSMWSSSGGGSLLMPDAESSLIEDENRRPEGGISREDNTDAEIHLLAVSV